MTNIDFLILKLRRFAFLLFLVPAIGLLGSLFFHNILVQYNYTYHYFEDGKKYPIKKICNSQNNYCIIEKLVKAQKFDDCPKFIPEIYVLINGEKIHANYYVPRYFLIKDKDGNIVTESHPDKTYHLKKEFLDVKIEKTIFESDVINYNCIKNFSYYNIYKKIPFIFEFLNNLKKNNKYISATSETIYPFLYGESSISNIVKRFPINYLFKPLLYISSILMMIYWLYYHKIFKLIEKKKRINKFLIFGAASSIFLFFHVLFLGTGIENEIFTKLRKLIIVLFIFCELTAQFFLAKRIYVCRTLIAPYTFKPVIYLKIAFVATIILISITIIGILTVYNLPPNVDYFLEWNYFLILLLFYLLSSIMWRSIN